MRIIGGQWRGRPIKAPQGRDTRPTQDRIRESIASMVYSHCGGIEGISVLDAFAGSGAMALEMLSRGAAHATALDADQRAVRTVKENAEKLGVPRSSLTVLRADAFVSAGRGMPAGAPFDVVFLDPPYATEATEVARLLEGLASVGALVEGALVVYERASRAPQVSPAGFAAVSSRSVGTTAIDALTWVGADAGQPCEDEPRDAVEDGSEEGPRAGREGEGDGDE